MTRLTCATETPSAAGAMSLSTRRHALVLRVPFRHRQHADAQQERDLEGELQRRRPTNTAQASARIGRSKYGAAKSAKPMKERFSSTGVKAGALNEPQVFRIPAAKLVSEMKRMYGKQILSIVTVSANLSASFANPHALA